MRGLLLIPCSTRIGESEALEHCINLLPLLEGLFQCLQPSVIGSRLDAHLVHDLAECPAATGLAGANLPERLLQLIQGLVGHLRQLLQLISLAEPDPQGQIPPHQLFGGLLEAIQGPGETRVR